MTQIKKRSFKGKQDFDKDQILLEHDLNNDFGTQDLRIESFLDKTKNKFIKAGTVTSLLPGGVEWSKGFNPQNKDQLYVISVDGYIVKYGMTETGLEKRHNSLLTGKPKYSKNNKNSETNRRSYAFLGKALQQGKKVEYYAANLEVHEIIYESIDGEICISRVAPTREEELKLAKVVLTNTGSVQPLLNVQLPGGLKNK